MKNQLIFLFVGVLLFQISFVVSINDYNVYGSSVNPQFTNPSYGSNYGNGNSYNSGFGSYSSGGYIGAGNFDRSLCQDNEDIIMQIIPGSCSPAVVRSDLLEEQNVPVFCKVRSIQINPLIDVSRIRSLHFKGEYPKGVSGVSYFPSRVAVRRTDRYNQPNVLDSLINDDLGYLVIVVSRQALEKDMPDYVEGNITATIDYDSEGVFGVGDSDFYINEMSDKEWLREYRENGFWNGKGYVRAESIDSEGATIALYRDANSRQTSIILRKGETSREVHLDGYYCSAGVKIKLEDIRAPVDSALIQVNDKQTWVSNGDRFLDGRCRVSNLKISGGGGTLSVSCSAQNGRFDLSLNSGAAEFILEDGRKERVAINERIDVNKNIYLAYIGQDKDNQKYAVLIDDEFSNGESAFLEKEIYSVVDEVVGNEEYKIDDLKTEIQEDVKKQYKKFLSRDRSSNIDENLRVEILKEGESYLGVGLDFVSAIVDKNWNAEGISGEEILAKEYYDLSIEKYEDLVDLYPDEKGPENDVYAANGLFEAAQLSRQFGMNNKAVNFYEQIIRDYPNSYAARDARRNKDLLVRYDNSNSKGIVLINNEQHFIDLLDFKSPSKSEAGAVLMIDGAETTLGLNEIKRIKEDKYVSKSIEIKKIDNNDISIRYTREDGSSRSSSRDYKLDLYNNKEVNLDGSRVRLLAINIKEQARISIQPVDYGTRTNAKFSFRIGIEKRAIQLSPEKAKEMAESLVESIKKLNAINEQLGNVIKVMKAACFATSALLTSKNLFTGLNGESIARNDLMTNLGGWNEKCEELVNEKKYVSLQQCLMDKKSQIEGDVQIYADEIGKTNTILKGIQNEVGIERSDFLDFEGQVDTSEVEKKFKGEFENWCKGKNGEINLPGEVGEKVSFNGENGICSWESLTHEQRREIMTLSNIQNSGSETLQDMTDKELGRIVLMGKNYEENTDAIKTQGANENYKNLGIKTTNPFGDSITYGDIKTITKGDVSHDIYKNFETGKNVVRIYIPASKVFGKEIFSANETVKGKEVIVEVNRRERTGGEYNPEGSIYLVSTGEKLEGAAEASVREYMSLSGMNRLKQNDEMSYTNPIQEKDRLRVKYFDREPYKGLPSEIPFDVENGWYVEMTYVLSGFGKPYDESGRVVNYYICNVGENGLIEFKKSGDDVCRYYNERTGAEINFPGMSVGDSRKLIDKAQRAIIDASKQYGREKVNINGHTFDSGISFGGESGRCTDFMAVEDCNLLFNVCDPIVCPASRCDLGGDYRVDNVMQTGIIGSLVLCLPNYKEGIIVPICLTGVHAGLEGYISILNSTAECLKESVESGRNIGICDEIKSIYVCEFFWKQAGPFLEVLVPRLLGGLSGQVRGGGEYGAIQSAWQNTQNAIGYFKNEYARESMLAFNSRSTSEIGGDFCKSFISQTVPGSASFFDTLIEPDSPVQYHAWFSENPMTSATVPAMSHYKVYFHIYAGKDIGSQYNIYLKDLSNLDGYIHTTGYYGVDRGYIARGSQADKARDFTAPSGFKQLCVSVNGKEECGFGKVSTSYVINRINDEYVQDQIDANIISENDCVAGTPSALSLINPNIQSVVEDVLSPELYSQGIIRVCATDNPGKQVISDKSSTSSRWKEVGYCDDQSIKCWLDTDSVKDVVRDKEIEGQILEDVALKDIFGNVDYLVSSESASLASKIDNSIKNLIVKKGESESSVEEKIKKIVDDLKILSEIGTNNIYRARGLYLFGKLYKKVASNLLDVEIRNEGFVSDSYEDLHPEGEEVVEVNDEVEIKDSKEDLTPSGGDNNEEVVKETIEPVDEEIVWTDEMLRDSVKINLENKGWWIFSPSINYKYIPNREFVSWRWTSNNDREFTDKNLGYVEGLRKIVEKTKSGGKISISSEEIEKDNFKSEEKMLEKIFEVLKK
jgi:hypothetical protein